MRALIVGRGPWGNMYEFSIAFAVGHRGRLPVPGPSLPHPRRSRSCPSAWRCSSSATRPRCRSAIEPLVPALDNAPLLTIHVAMAMIGYGMLRDQLRGRRGLPRPGRRPTASPGCRPHKVLDEVAYRAVIVGFPIFATIIILGCYWASIAWGRYWGWDPKETSALVTWLIYAVYLHARSRRAGRAGRPRSSSSSASARCCSPTSATSSSRGCTPTPGCKPRVIGLARERTRRAAVDRRADRLVAVVAVIVALAYLSAAILAAFLPASCAGRLAAHPPRSGGRGIDRHRRCHALLLRCVRGCSAGRRPDSPGSGACCGAGSARSDGRVCGWLAARGGARRCRLRNRSSPHRLCHRGSDSARSWPVGWSRDAGLRRGAGHGRRGCASRDALHGALAAHRRRLGRGSTGARLAQPRGLRLARHRHDAAALLSAPSSARASNAPRGPSSRSAASHSTLPRWRWASSFERISIVRLGAICLLMESLSLAV